MRRIDYEKKTFDQSVYRLYVRTIKNLYTKQTGNVALRLHTEVLFLCVCGFDSLTFSAKWR